MDAGHFLRQHRQERDRELLLPLTGQGDPMPVAWGKRRRGGRLGSATLPRVERKRTSEELDSLVGATLGGAFSCGACSAAAAWGRFTKSSTSSPSGPERSS